MFIYLKEILYLIGEDKKKVKVLIFLFLISSVFDLVGISMVAPYISLVIEEGQLDGNFLSFVSYFNLPNNKDWLLVFFGITIIVIFFIKTVSIILIFKKIVYFSQEQQVKISSYLMHVYQRLPYTVFINRNSSDYIYNIQTLTVQFSQVILFLLKLSGDIVIGVLILILLAWQNIFALSLLVIITGGFALIYDLFFKKKISFYGKIANNSATSMVKGIHEGMEGYKEIRVLGSEKFFYEAVLNGAKGHAKYHTKSQIISVIPRYTLEFLMVFFIVSFSFMMMKIDKDAQTLAPTLGMFAIAALRLLPSINGISNGLLQLRYGRDSVSRLYEDMKRISSTKLMDIDNNIKEVQFKSIELSNVSFAYPQSANNVLNNISLKIKSKESIGIIGKSGSGKTTLIDLLLGLLEPNKGVITYNDNVKLSSIIHSQVAYLPQQVFLIDDSLRNNIAINSKNIDEAKVLNAIKKSRLLELLESLPEGLDTVIGERGVKLSGGQRQRVALARTFYHERNILIMDESTSALDDKTEREIVDEIERLKGDKTLIVIAHRLSTLRNCDVIYRIENGKIVSSGSYRSMVENISD